MTPAADDFPGDAAVEYNPEDEPPASEAERIKRDHEDELLSMPSVTGVGLAQNAVGDDAIIIYLRHGSAASNLPKQIEGIDVVTEVTGEIDAY